MKICECGAKIVVDVNGREWCVNTLAKYELTYNVKVILK